MSYTKRTVPRLLLRVWDLPTRLFIWATLLGVVAGALGAYRSWNGPHFVGGYGLLALLLFRVAWGFAGSDTSRFRTFLLGPDSVRRQLATFRSRDPDDTIGHSAAGGWLLVALLTLLGVVVVTGLLGRGDGAVGPLAAWVTDAAGRSLAGLHGLAFVLLGAVALLGLGALLADAAAKRQDLLRPFITGRKRLPANLRQPRFASTALAAALLAASAGLVWALLRLS